MNPWINNFISVVSGKRVRSGILAAFILALLVLLTPSGDDKSTPIRSAFDPIDHNNVAPVTFEDQTLSSGLVFSHLQGGYHLTGLTETLGSGACAFDYDNDGWVDLFLVNGSGQTKYYGTQQWWHLPKGHVLYRNTGNGKFEDVSQRAGFNKQSWGMGCASGDLDNDGDDDLVITNNGANLLYRNNGNGTFSDVSLSSGLSGSDWSTSAAIADYDGDGLLDLYIVNYLHYKKGAHTYEAGRQYGSQDQAAFDPTLYPGVGNRLYQNIGKLEFKDVTDAAGVANSSGRGLAAMWLDLDQQNGADLLVINDTGIPNAVFINSGDGKFAEHAADYKLNSALGSHGLAVGDLSNTGVLSLALTSPANQTLQIYNPVNKDKQTTYQDEARQLGIGTEQHASLNGWGIGLHDFNRDGWLDVFSVNGLVTPDPDTAKLPQGQLKQLWLNQNGARFNMANAASPALADTQSGRGAVFADFDNDGDMDIYVAHNNDLGQLLVNQSEQQNWVGFKLRRENKSGNIQGTKLTLHTTTGIQTRIINSSGFLSDSDRRVLFGLGRTDSIKKLTAIWPNGESDSWSDVPINHYHTVRENESALAAYAPTVSAPMQSKPAGQVTPFNAEHRSALLAWLVTARGMDSSLPKMKQAFSDVDASVRLTAIELSAKHRGPHGLSLLVDSLSDPVAANRVASVTAMSQHEDEASIRWLLRHFTDPAPEVRRALADRFASFYREEEAVVYRKYLALPHLIQLLGDSEPDVRIAAIRALGNAERYRAVDPLIDVLASTDPVAQMEAARALGLIREKRAMQPLLAAFQNNNLAPLVRAHALIALQRLGYKKTYPALRRLLANPKDNEKSLRIFHEILSDRDDGIVLKKNILGKMLIDFIKRKIKATPDWVHSPGAAGAAETLGVIQSKPAQLMLRPFIKSTNKSTRQQAYAALSPSIDPTAAATLAKGLLDSSAKVRLAALGSIIRERATIPASKLESVLNDNALRDKLAVYLKDNPDKRHTTTLLKLVRQDGQKPEQIASALKILSTIKVSKPRLNRSFLQSPHAIVRHRALQYWASRLPAHGYSAAIPAVLDRALNDADSTVRITAIEILISRNEAWASKAIEGRLFSANTDMKMKKQICSRLGRSRRDSRILIRLSRLRHDPAHQYAFRRLAQLQDAEADGYLLTVLKDKRESNERRFMAAKALYPRHGKTVVATLSATPL